MIIPSFDLHVSKNTFAYFEVKAIDLRVGMLLNPIPECIEAAILSTKPYFTVDGKSKLKKPVLVINPIRDGEFNNTLVVSLEATNVIAYTCSFGLINLSNDQFKMGSVWKVIS